MAYLAFVKKGTTIPLTTIQGNKFTLLLYTLKRIAIIIGKEIPTELRFVQLNMENILFCSIYKSHSIFFSIAGLTKNVGNFIWTILTINETTTTIAKQKFIFLRKLFSKSVFSITKNAMHANTLTSVKRKVIRLASAGTKSLMKMEQI